MDVIRTVAELRARVALWRRAGEGVAVVPTMGALHAGHLSLVEEARRRAARVIVTLFVNPKQFNNPADLKSYPRTEESDRAVLAPLGVDVLFAPDSEEVYPRGFATNVSESGLSEGLCGAHRPGHFDGVSTVVAKLFLMTGANVAIFGEKDWQQLQIVRRMAADLNIPVDIVSMPTVREADGLALSSRNARLSPAQRAAAACLPRALETASAALAKGAALEPTLAAARAAILAGGYARVDYLELRDGASLAPLDAAAPGARLLAAAWLEEVRLIDNLAVS